jgi:hypothetical protein
VAAEWTISDAWIFSAIAGGNAADGDGLSELIMRADLISHAIPTEAEFVRAMGRLHAAGLVDLNTGGDRFWLSAAGQLLRQRLSRRGLFGWTDVILPGLRKLEPPKEGDWALPGGAFDRAVNEYLARARGPVDQ